MVQNMILSNRRSIVNYPFFIINATHGEERKFVGISSRCPLGNALIEITAYMHGFVLMIVDVFLNDEFYSIPYNIDRIIIAVHQMIL